MELSSVSNEFGMVELILAVGILFLAYLVRGITGFGSALVAVPFLLFILPFKIVIPWIVALDYMASASHGIKHRKAISWHDILPLLPFTLVGVLSAIYVFRTVDVQLLLKILGGLIVGYAVYSLFPFHMQHRHSRLWAIPAASLGGLIGTLFATGGPFYVIYLKLRGLDKAAFRSSIAAILLLDGGMRLTGFLLSGFYTVKILLMFVLSLPVMWLALYIGGHIHLRISQPAFQKIISITLICSGVGLMLK